MFDVFLTGSVAFIITFLAIPVVLQIAEQKKLFDVPDERKVHARPVASLGGVGIFGGFLLAALLSISEYTNPEFQYFFAAALVIFFLGLKDDLVVLSAFKKIIGQLIAASILIHLGGIKLTSMHGLFGIYEVPAAFGLAMSYLTIIVVINSFNLIDGVDGLAGTLGLFTTTIFGIYFFAADQLPYSLLSFSMCGSLLAFLIFNHHPAKIFMGDSGSLMIGLVNAILVIKFLNIADAPGAILPVASPVAMAFAILMVPLFDTMRVFAIRIVNGRSPFTPDRNHIHHLMLNKGLNHSAITYYCLLLNIFFVLLAYSGKTLGSGYLLSIMLSLSFLGIGLLYYHKTRTKLVLAKRVNEQLKTDYKPATKVVTLTKESIAAEQN
ncbi:MAG: undecaprenyl/decaprenyl-phosphate alpha-N-acetylglucosaminyl 1-phosphate transferase [Bacteroidetes bacterium]|nr:undecaprenyl/decaprenyl-phosphate alpha-N-acetylglucosaminyl 1-phosphate transferase [Bacteroidota bacterium]